MLEPNEEIPGIAFNIARLREIGEPYLFGRFETEMAMLLQEKGYGAPVYYTGITRREIYGRENTFE